MSRRVWRQRVLAVETKMLQRAFLYHHHLSQACGHAAGAWYALLAADHLAEVVE